MKQQKRSPKKRFTKGYAALLVATFLMATNKYLFKLTLLTLPLVPFMAIRHLIAGTLALPYARKTWKKISPRNYFYIFMLSAIGLGGSNGLWALGAQHSSLMAAGLLGLLSPIFTYLFAALLLRETMSPRAKFGASLAFGGTALLVYMTSSGGGGTNTFLGPLLIVISNALGALFVVISKKLLAHIDPAQFSSLQLIFVGVPFTVVMIATGSYGAIVHISRVSLIALIILCTTNGGLAWVLENYALKRVHGSVLAEQGYLDVLIVSLISIFIAGEVLNLNILAGGALILLGSIISHQHISKVWALHKLKTSEKAIGRALREAGLALERLVGKV